MSRLDVNDLPWSNEAEQSVLGALLIDNGAWDRCADVLLAASFFDARHGALFNAIGSLINANKPADVVTVYERLVTAGTTEELGGLAYLNDLAQCVPSAHRVRHYAEIVAEKAGLRALMQSADEAIEIAQGEAPFSDKADRIVTMFLKLQQTGRKSMPVPASSTVCTAVDRYNDLSSGNVPPGLPTGLADLDKALNGGMRTGKVIVIAARPSVGKSALALAILLHCAKAGEPGLFLSQEMDNQELTDRALANLGGIGYGRLQNGQLSDAEWSRLSAAVDQLGKLPIWFDDQAALTLHDIRVKAAAVKREGLRVLVIDYLQLCAGAKGSRADNRNAEIEEISRGLKQLAKDLGITILLLSQLSRAVEKRASPEPVLADLRDSGSIEQDADAVLFLWRIREDRGVVVVGASLPKNRQGKPNAKLTFEFQGFYQRWIDSAPDSSYASQPVMAGFDN